MIPSPFVAEFLAVAIDRILAEWSYCVKVYMRQAQDAFEQLRFAG